MMATFAVTQGQPRAQQQSYMAHAPAPPLNYPPRIPWALSGANTIPVGAAPQAASPGYTGNLGPIMCHFCGKEGEFIRACPIVQEYIASGRVIRGTQNRLQLPNNYVMPWISNKMLKEQINAYYAVNPGHLLNPLKATREVLPHVATTNLILIVVSPDPPTTGAVSDGELLTMLQGLRDISEDDGDTQAVFEAAVAKIRKAKFDGVELSARPELAWHPRTAPAAPTAPPAPPMKVTPITMPVDHTTQYQYRAPIKEDSHTGSEQPLQSPSGGRALAPNPDLCLFCVFIPSL